MSEVQGALYMVLFEAAPFDWIPVREGLSKVFVTENYGAAIAMQMHMHESNPKLIYKVFKLEEA